MPAPDGLTPNFRIPREVLKTGIVKVRTFNAAMDRIDDMFVDVEGGSAEAPAVIFDCAAGVSVGDWVAIGTSGNEVVLADAGSVNLVAVGVVSAKPISTKAVVLMGGILGGFSGLNPQDLIFLSPTPGEHVVNPDFSTIPSEFKVVQRLGTARNATTVVIAPGLVVEIEPEP